MEYNHVLLKMLNVSIFTIPYVGIWLLLVYKLRQVSTIPDEYNNIFIFISAVLFFSRLNYMAKPKHIVDEIISACHVFIGCILYIYSTYLSFYFKDDFLSISCIIMHILFLYTFIFHSKKYIDPHLTLSDYLKVETVQLDDDNNVIDLNTNSDVLI